MKARISKTSKSFNDEYFKKRSSTKNALALSSNQSKPINSYDLVKENYDKALKNNDLKVCPDFWGGYSLVPYYFEFWEGHESRINKREAFDMTDGIWKHSFLQP
jgi:pyridoxamine 5'-phosphate oxidase